jgi:hypothetical protein
MGTLLGFRFGILGTKAGPNGIDDLLKAWRRSGNRRLPGLSATVSASPQVMGRVRKQYLISVSCHGAVWRQSIDWVGGC